MRTLVTGGAGFLGSWLCEAVLERGESVVCVDNLVTGSAANVEPLHDRFADRFEFVQADISASLDVDGPVDRLFHLASPASPPRYLDLPVETLKVGSVGTLHALELAQQKQARFVLASTSEVYGDPLQSPQPETYWGNVNPVGPRSVYDEAKRFSEALTMAFRRSCGVDTAIARIFNSYGPRMQPDDGRVVGTFVNQALKGAPITVFGNGRQTRSLCYVSDTVAGLLALADSAAAGPVNIGNPDELTVLEIAERVRAATGSSVPITFGDLPVDDPKLRCPDISLARQLLGWEPRVGAGEGLRRFVEWARAAHWGERREAPPPG